MPRDVGIATRLRAAGLRVREVEGWKTRGSSDFSPRGSVNHHTAGPPQSAGRVAPSLGVVINGRSDLPGPLCNVYQDYEDTIYVVAAGRANHAGIPDGGSCRGMTGNTTAYGLEIEHPGTSLLPAARVRIAARVHAALLHGKGIPASQVVQHREWAPSRKIDLATNFATRAQQDGFRAMVAAELRKLEQPEPQPKVRYVLTGQAGGVIARSGLAVKGNEKSEKDRLRAFLKTAFADIYTRSVRGGGTIKREDVK